MFSIRNTIHDELASVQSRVVEQLERPHRVTEAQLHGRVDVLGRGVTLNNNYYYYSYYYTFISNKFYLVETNKHCSS